MSHRSVFLTFAIALPLLGGLGVALFFLVRHEADWYLRAGVPPGEHRLQCSEKFQEELTGLINGAKDDKEWGAQLTDELINSFFEEDFVQSHLDSQMLPHSVSQPRVAIERDRLRVAFRYGHGSWSTVISIDLGIWLARNAENAVVVEVESFRAGALPISAQSILQDITAAIKATAATNKNDLEVNWYRHPENGHPCAVVRFQADQERPTMLLQAVRLDQGKMIIRGRANDGASAKAISNLPGFALVRSER